MIVSKSQSLALMLSPHLKIGFKADDVGWCALPFECAMVFLNFGVCTGAFAVLFHCFESDGQS